MVAILNNQTAAQPGTQCEDPRLVTYVAQSQITVELLSIHFLLCSQSKWEFVWYYARYQCNAPTTTVRERVGHRWGFNVS